MIVIDEEHETSFKQDNTPRYHAREVARRRAETEKVPARARFGDADAGIVAAGAAQEDRLLSLPNRVEELVMPPVIIVDTRNDPRIEGGAAIGRSLEQAMRNALQKERPGDSVSQCPRLFAAALVPRLRSRSAMPALRCDVDLAQAARHRTVS